MFIKFFRETQGCKQACVGAVLKKFVIFTGKHLCMSLFLGSCECNSSEIFVKFSEKQRDVNRRFFLVTIAKFLRRPIMKNFWKRLLLPCQISMIENFIKQRFYLVLTKVENQTFSSYSIWETLKPSDIRRNNYFLKYPSLVPLK